MLAAPWVSVHIYKWNGWLVWVSLLFCKEISFLWGLSPMEDFDCVVWWERWVMWLVGLALRPACWEPTEGPLKCQNGDAHCRSPTCIGVSFSFPRQYAYAFTKELSAFQPKMLWLLSTEDKVQGREPIRCDPTCRPAGKALPSAPLLPWPEGRISPWCPVPPPLGPLSECISGCAYPIHRPTPICFLPFTHWLKFLVSRERWRTLLSTVALWTYSLFNLTFLLLFLFCQDRSWETKAWTQHILDWKSWMPGFYQEWLMSTIFYRF